MKTQNKRKIINDPVYGFINIPSDIIFDLLQHPYFQRLRRIKQLGLTHFVYPGALHTRFQHAIGALYLMTKAIDVLKSKGHYISDEENEAVCIAILLHDIGHGPFSHALEHSIIKGVSHEEISISIIRELNIIFNGKLDLALKIFQDKYQRKFLHQLVSGQLDMDRLDYLRRDSFFTGVSEGVVGSDRIIKMLNIVNDELVIEAKGIYSVEKFLIARRFMYWQVYLHKTVLSAENMLIKTLKRANELANKGIELFATPSLHFFLYNEITDFDTVFDGKSILELFTSLDDDDIMVSIKEWAKQPDKVLSHLSKSIINRELFRIEIQDKKFNKNRIEELKVKAAGIFNIKAKELEYFVFSDSVSNFAYTLEDTQINILKNNGDLVELSKASDILNIKMLSKKAKKYFLIYPKSIL